ncbi:unnamed protein product [Toxocara canis]|uniref:ANF_receptor domain-containing protein n=1 Tax=Toxocara canis TaxID=6265 RepID=A0A183V2S9_TOXCA|nr:unnamed protein product [Toxocara canis]
MTRKDCLDLHVRNSDDKMKVTQAIQFAIAAVLSSFHIKLVWVDVRIGSKVDGNQWRASTVNMLMKFNEQMYFDSLVLRSSRKYCNVTMWLFCSFIYS